MRGLYLKGIAEINMIEHIIDCNSFPLQVPEGWEIQSHNIESPLAWNANKVTFYFVADQKNTSGIVGNKLCIHIRSSLSNLHVLNANVLEYLLERPVLIPEEWKKVCVFFWGTIYLDEHKRHAVRFLYQGVRNNWKDGYRLLDDEWFDHQPAVILKS